MEGQSPSKRRRVYSPEPNKIAKAVFATKYVNYLVPALMKMKEKKVKVVKYEVGMAMVCSAQGFAWSNALKTELQRDVIEGSCSSSNPSSKSDEIQKCEHKGLVMEDSEDGKTMSDEFRRLRRLIPGGEEMGDDEQMVAELESYLSCLQMQVNILQCLAERRSY